MSVLMWPELFEAGRRAGLRECGADHVEQHLAAFDIGRECGVEDGTARGQWQGILRSLAAVLGLLVVARVLSERRP